MPKDVIVVVTTDAKPRTSETLDILLVNTEGDVPLATYRSLAEVEAKFPKTSTTYLQASAIFNQGKTTQADTLIDKVRIVGFEVDGATELIQALEVLREQNDDWYILLTDRTETSYQTALAEWTEHTEPTEAELGAGQEDHRKFYFFQTDDPTIAITNRRCACIYTDNLTEQADAAFLGNVGAHYPESVTWKFKNPQGLTLPDLTMAQKNALEEKKINFLTSEYKYPYVKNGVCCDGEFIDVQLGADYIAMYMRDRLYEVLLTNAKVPYTDEGFAMVADAVFRSLNRAVDLGIIARDPDSKRGVYRVTVPTRAQATDDQARARIMPDITWEAQLEGSVHGVKTKGVLRATLSA